MVSRIAACIRAEFPYVSPSSTTLSAGRWCLVLGSVALAVVLLLFMPALFQEYYLTVPVSILLFSIVPIITFSIVSRDNGAGLFRPVTRKVIGQSIGFGVLTFIVSVSSAMLMTQVMETAPNAGVHALGAMSAEQKIRFFLFSIPQLFGEEVITILPFLAILYCCLHVSNASKPQAVLLAWVITAVWFALIHLPAYNWNLLQVLWGIGIARLLLTAVFIITKNLWVSTGAHITNDWLMFGISLIASNQET